MYSGAKARDAGIEAVQHHAPVAVLVTSRLRRARSAVFPCGGAGGLPA